LSIQHGFPVPAFADGLTAHIAKHVWAQEQWVVTTTTAEYLEDIRAAIVADTSRLVVFLRSRRPVVAILARTIDAVPLRRRGPDEGRYLLIVYSPDNAMILTAYMVGAVQDANIPAGAQWLT